jgi:hypothetical protein
MKENSRKWEDVKEKRLRGVEWEACDETMCFNYTIETLYIRYDDIPNYMDLVLF